MAKLNFDIPEVKNRLDFESLERLDFDEPEDKFEPIFQRTLDLDGGFVVDEGGPTNLGITQTLLDSFNKQRDLPKEDVRELTEGKTRQVFREEFYERPKIDRLPDATASLTFDFGVQSSPKRAVQFLQREIGATQDGKIGPNTLRKTNEFIEQNGERALLQRLIDGREGFLRGLESFKTKGRGFLNRINKLKSEFDLSALNPLGASTAEAGEGDLSSFGVEREDDRNFGDAFQEAVVKPLIRGFEGIPVGVQSVWQVGIDNIREIASKQLKEDGAVFGLSKEEFAKRTPEQQKRINRNNEIVESLNKAEDTSKRIQQDWIKAAGEGFEAKDAKVFQGTFMENPSWTRALALGFESAPLLGIAAAVTAATKSPIAGASIIGAIEAADEFGVAREKGLPIKEANIIALTDMVALSALETIPLTGFLKGGRLPKRMFRGAIQEGSEEVLQEIWKDSVAKIGYDETRNITEGLVEAFIGGAVSGGIIGGLSPANIMDEKLNTARSSGVNVDAMITAVGEQVVNEGQTILDKFTETLEISRGRLKSEKGQAGFEEGKPEEGLIEEPSFKEQAIAKEKAIKKEELEKPSVLKPKEVKKTVREVTGQVKEPELKQLAVKLKAQVKGARIGLKEGIKTQKIIEQEKKLKTLQAKEEKGILSIKEKELLKISLKQQAKGARISRISTKQEVKSVQNDIIDTINASNLEKEEKGSFIATIKNTQTTEQLSRALPKLEARIDRLENDIQKRELVSEFKKLTKPSDLKKLRPEFLKPVQEIIEDLSIVRPTEKKLNKLRRLAEFIEREPENQVPDKVLSRLKTLSDVPLRDLTVDDIEAITGSVAHLVKLNELKNKIIIKNKLKDFDEVKTAAVSNVSRRTDKLDGSITGLDSRQQEHESGLARRIFGTDSYNAELKAEILDGVEDGVIQQVIYNGIDDGVKEQFKFQHEAEDFFKDRLKGLDIDNFSRMFKKKEKDLNKFEVKISTGDTLTMTKGERIAFELHNRNARNMKHVLKGGFSFQGTPSKIIKITEEDVVAILKDITPNEKKVADAIHEYLNTVQKDAINKVSVDLLGHEIAREPDYFPIRTNFLDRFKDKLIKTGNFSKISLEGLGIFKERQSASNALIIEDAFSTVYKSMHQVSAYVGLAKPLRSARALLDDNDFQIAVRSVGRKDYINSFNLYLDRVEGDSLRLDNVDKLVQQLINKLDVAILGLNPWVMAKQPISYMLAATEMEMKYVSGSFGFNPSKAEIAEIKKYSPHLRDRFEGNVTREMGEIAQVGRPKKFFTGKEVVSRVFMSGISEFDKAAIASIWRATKKQVSAESPDLKGDEFFEKVADMSWKTIRRTQPTFHVKDRSTIGASKNVFVRLATKYSSQRNKNWMIIRRAFERYNRSKKTAKDKSDLAQALFLVTIMAPLLLITTDHLRDKFLGRREKEKLLKKASEGFININFGNIYFLGTGMNSLISKINKGTFSGYDINDPLTSTMDDIIDTLANGYRSIGQAVREEKFKSGKRRGQLKWKKSLGQFLKGSLDLTGQLTGVPIKSVRKLLLAGVKKFLPKDKKKSGNRLSF